MVLIIIVVVVVVVVIIIIIIIIPPPRIGRGSRPESGGNDGTETFPQAPTQLSQKKAARSTRFQKPSTPHRSDATDAHGLDSYY